MNCAFLLDAPVLAGFFAGAFVGIVIEHVLRGMLGRAMRERK